MRSRAALWWMAAEGRAGPPSATCTLPVVSCPVSALPAGHNPTDLRSDRQVVELLRVVRQQINKPSRTLRSPKAAPLYSPEVCR